MAEIIADAGGFLIGLVGMEGVAWVVHRYLMHGSLWVLHQSHHRARRGPVELNDLFGLGFAAVAIVFFLIGARPGWSPLWWFAAGMTAYGVLYTIVHDGLVHRRWPLGLRSDRGYLGRLAQAHRLHHATLRRDGAVSFGFLVVGDPDRLAADLRQHRGRPR